MSAPSPVTGDTLEQAAKWFVDLTEQPALKESSAFRAWMAVDHHRAAWQSIQSGLEPLDNDLAADELALLRRQALRRSAQAGLVRRSWRALSAVAAVVIVAIGVGSMHENRRTYKTAPDERRPIILADDSRLWLDSGSEAEVRYSLFKRDVVLRRGQGYFEVAHEGRRPFVVYAGDTRVRATGTAFNVERLSGAVIVTLAEGRVAVRNAADRADLSPGQQLTVTAGGPLTRRTIDPAAALAWRGGKVVMEDEPLGIAAQRINRYGTGRVTVDPRAYGIRVTGSFPAGDKHSFVDGVSSYFNLETESRPDGSVYLRPRG